MARISVAIKQNNAAASLIERGRYNEAIKILKALIPRFQDDFKAQAAQQEEIADSEPHSILLHNLILQSASTMMDRKGTGVDEHEGFLYDQAVEIPQSRVSALETPSAAVSIILLFNLALALHLKAIAATKESHNTRAMSDRCFASSMSLYRVVAALNGSNRLLSMIVLNNVAMIHQKYKEKEKAQECFHRLLAIWTMSPVCSKDLEGMVHNAMGWYDSSALPAAAA